jgi:hypothetical protein
MSHPIFAQPKIAPNNTKYAVPLYPPKKPSKNLNCIRRDLLLQTIQFTRKIFNPQSIAVRETSPFLPAKLNNGAKFCHALQVGFDFTLSTVYT